MDDLVDDLLPIALAFCVVIIGCLIFYIWNNVSAPKNTIKKSDSSADISVGLKREAGCDQTVVSSSSEKVLHVVNFNPFKVLKVTKISSNTKLIRFEIPFGSTLGLSIGRHISLRAEIDGKHVIRPYTPTSRPDARGYFDLLIKSYDHGKMSPYLHSLKIGQSIEVRGPIGRFKYTPNQYTGIGLLAGGTGVTPCLQVIRCILQCDTYKSDMSNFVLFFQNRSEEDILLRSDLDALQFQYPDRLKIVYFLSNPLTQTYGNDNNSNKPEERKGHINANSISEYMNTNACQLVCICGPSSFNESMKNLAISEGHNEETGVYVW
eukprot:gene4641-6522_t